MTQTLRRLALQILAFATLTVVLIPLLPTASPAAPRQLFCEDSSDCPNGSFCRARLVHGKWVGHCVGLPARRAALFCENNFDCPIFQFCRIPSGRKTGHCASPGF